MPDKPRYYAVQYTTEDGRTVEAGPFSTPSDAADFADTVSGAILAYF